jgi:prophage maintenance system killer protein
MNQVEIYQSSGKDPRVEVWFKDDTVWLTQKEITQLFDRDRTVITKHINNVFKEGELNKDTVCALFAHTAEDGKTYETQYYNLDVIISVGYRVKSKQGTQFRQWATQRLKDYLIKGYALNVNRLKRVEGKYQELQQAVKLITQAASKKSLDAQEARGILKILEQYSQALEMLDQYDHQRLPEIKSGKKPVKKLTYHEAINQVNIWRKVQRAGKLFGNEKDQSFKSSLNAIYQTFDGKDLYTTLDEKAAHLLYFVVKNHSFTDGNKRIAAGLFLYFLDMNKSLLTKGGVKRMDDPTLVAVTLLIAESKPEEKEQLVKLIVNLMKA